MRTIVLVSALAACTPESAEDPVVVEPPQPYVAQTVSFLRADDGVSEAFDLDAAVTRAGDVAGCGVPDLRAPDGTEGVDNSFAELLPVLEAAGGSAIPFLVQAAVDAGALLLSFEIGEEDATGCVPVVVGRAQGTPMIGGDGRLLAGQTFDRHPDFPTSETCGWWEDGVLRASGPQLDIELVVFDEWVDVPVIGWEAWFEPLEDGAWRARIGGGVPIAELQANVATFDGIGQQIPLIIETALAARADLAPVDGACTQMSTWIDLNVVPAFFYPDGAE